MTQEVLKQALDALEASIAITMPKIALRNKAITAIKEALAQPQQEPPFSVQQAYAMAQVCLDLHEALGCKWGDNPYLAIAGLREAQSQQEPVAWMIWTHHPVLVFMNKDEANLEFDRLNHAYPEPTRMLVALYTSPPQRKPLTHEEIWDAIRPLTKSDEVCRALVDVSMDEYRAIEAAHGIKE